MRASAELCRDEAGAAAQGECRVIRAGPQGETGATAQSGVMFGDLCV